MLLLCYDVLLELYYNVLVMLLLFGGIVHI
jgi:hypothetical protein